MVKPQTPSKYRVIQLVLLFQLTGLLALTVGADIARGSNQRCSNTSVIVQSGEPRDVAEICRAATMATDLLSRCGVVRDVDLIITLADEVRHPCGVVVLGQHLAKQDRIELTTFARCVDALGPDNAYRQLPQREVWRSLAVHEITHGIVSHAARAEDLAPMAQEYVAYAIQISSLPVGSRQKLLKAMPGKTPSDTTSFTELYHAIAPLRFGVNAYRHYSAMPDRCAFLEQVLRGEIEFPSEDG